MYRSGIIKTLISLLLLLTLVGLISNLILYEANGVAKNQAPILIGQDQAPINAENYKVLEEVAKNAQVPIEVFRHTKDRYQYVVSPEGFLYSDNNRNGIIDGEDAVISNLSLGTDYSYKTDKDGNVIVIVVDFSKFSDTSILNKFDKLIAIILNDNKIKTVDISNLAELRYLSITGIYNHIEITQLKNLNKLAYFELFGMDSPDFSGFSGVESLRKMELFSPGLESFNGLVNIPNLIDLDVEIVDYEEKYHPGVNQDTSTKLTSMLGVPKGHKLEKLRLVSTNKLDIQGIGNFSHLKKLELSVNFRAPINISGLSNLKKLEKLKLSAIGVNDFSFLNDMPKLKKIISRNSSMSSLKGLAAAPNLELLEFLDRYEGKIKKIDHLNNNIQLKTLILKKMEITKLEGLLALKNLHTLDLSNNNISKIQGLSGLERLKVLNFSDNNISEVEGLLALEKLKTLDLSGNGISKIEGLDNNLCLEKLWLTGNPINTFENIFHLPILGYLGIKNTNITAFPNWQNLKHLSELDADLDKLSHKNETPRYVFYHVPIQDFDVQMRHAKPVTDEERKQHGCI